VLWGPDDWDAWAIEDAKVPGSGLSLDAVRSTLCKVPRRERKSVADLGCGQGSLLPFLALNFSAVTAVDYAPASLAAARAACDEPNITFRRRDLRDLSPFRGRFHVAVAVDSIIGPRSSDLETILSEIWASLTEGGLLLATFPANHAPDRKLSMIASAERARSGPLHEVELQYRFRRAGFQGVRIRRLTGGGGSESRLLGLAVRRGMN